MSQHLVAEKIKQEVANRGISWLVHFTDVDNLMNIFNYGLLSIESLQKKGVSYFYNDAERWDGCLDALCLSIMQPNYKMFWKFRYENPSTDWVVLGINNAVLWEKECAFCVENAASNSVRHIPLEERKGVEAFRKMFQEYPGKPLRSQLGLVDSTTTNPQAEVLVFEDIEPSYIFAAAFENDYTMNKYKHLVPSGVAVQVRKWLFEQRSDYAHWQR